MSLYPVWRGCTPLWVYSRVKYILHKLIPLNILHHGYTSVWVVPVGLRTVGMFTRRRRNYTPWARSSLDTHHHGFIPLWVWFSVGMVSREVCVNRWWGILPIRCRTWLTITASPHTHSHNTLLTHLILSFPHVFCYRKIILYSHETPKNC